ncbi:tRNA cytosine34-C5-methyltransferase-like protein [Cinnamomum micranthum f. kanehirae]|uniref:tRNA cytosine34-C5-methyltransferase-like protein n=1 Tax=Cinnamomum micranthum f. kanehirae TaxID=337451 RepID=A0A443PNV3_9MAGN|nr:tRNA cytosine34-C5-methyltransferase-like protein [Cinnamomum micranthum f. kanehirae]
MGGGRKRGRTQRRHFRENRENVWKKSRSDTSTQQADDDNNNNNTTTWQPFATQNPAFEEYYKKQAIVPEEEWDEFLQVLRLPLPAAFRINSSGQFYRDIRAQLENDFVKTLEAEFTNENEVEPIRPLSWYPDNLAWHLNFSRMQLRKNQTLERFHEFLKQENEIGNITRQEAVSMIPPLFLDVHPDHFILDMCAAPGSKTFQLLEIVHQSTGPRSLPDGLVIANDVDVQRCNLLIHQTKRMCSANLIVTNHEAQHFPSCHLKSVGLEKSKSGSLNGDLMGNPQPGEGLEEPSERILLFDRVLCDVPCSGDGTLRKAPDIWRKWNAGLGNGLHRLQVQIAMRGLALLKVGGRMVYSTCSMNPVENEAVVAEVLRRCDGAVELVDVSGELPQLVRRSGLDTWKVRDRGMWLASYRDVPKYRRNAIVPSMFPSGETWEEAETVSDVQKDIDRSDNIIETKSTNLNEKDPNGGNVVCEYSLGHTENHATTNDSGEDMSIIEKPANNSSGKDLDTDDIEFSCLPLEHCMRILPHDQNSGAFFIAVLHKLSPLPAVSEKPRISGNRRGKLPDKLSDKTNPSEAIPVQDLVVDESLNLGSSENETSTVPIDVSMEDASNEISVKENELEDAIVKDDKLEEAKACDDEKSGLENTRTVKGRLQIQGKWRGVDPVVLFKDDTTINSIRNFYGVSDLFPLDGHLVTRNSDAHHVKRIYYISRSVHDILKLNFEVGQQLKITSVGLKMFERQTSKEGSSQCAFRISSEGLPLLLPYISKQILSASFVDFEHLLRYRTIKFADFVDATLGEKASKLILGCCVVVLNKGDQPSSETIVVDASTIAIGCWKGKSSLSVMVSQIDCQEMLERLSVRLGSGNGSLVQATNHGSGDANGVNEDDGSTMDTESTEDFETV